MRKCLWKGRAALEKKFTVFSLSGCFHSDNDSKRSTAVTNRYFYFSTQFRLRDKIVYFVLSEATARDFNVQIGFAFRALRAGGPLEDSSKLKEREIIRSADNYDDI